LAAKRRAELLKRVEDIRQRGYEYVEGEWMRGATHRGIAVGARQVRARAAQVVTVLRDDASPELFTLPKSACAAEISKAAGTTAFLLRPSAVASEPGAGGTDFSR